MKIVIDIDDDLYTRLFDNGVDNHDDTADMAKAIRKGTVLPKGHGRLLDENVVKQKVFDITDLYDSGKYLVFENGKYLIGDDIQNDDRRVLSFNEALQGVINGMSAIIEADKAESEVIK